MKLQYQDLDLSWTAGVIFDLKTISEKPECSNWAETIAKVVKMSLTSLADSAWHSYRALSGVPIGLANGDLNLQCRHVRRAVSHFTQAFVALPALFNLDLAVQSFDKLGLNEKWGKHSERSLFRQICNKRTAIAATGVVLVGAAVAMFSLNYWNLDLLAIGKTLKTEEKSYEPMDQVWSWLNTNSQTIGLSALVLTATAIATATAAAAAAIFAFQKHKPHENRTAFWSAPINESGISQTENSTTFRAYSELTKEDRDCLDHVQYNDDLLKIGHKQAPNMVLYVKTGDMFDFKGGVPDAVVNPANESMSANNQYGGVNLAIHKRWKSYGRNHVALGNRYQDSKYLMGHVTSIKSGANSKDDIQNVLVVVGPCLRKSEHETLDMTSEHKNHLYTDYYNIFSLATELRMKNVVSPSISTGIFRFDKSEAARIMLKAFVDFGNAYPDANFEFNLHFYIPDGKIEKDRENLVTHKQIIENGFSARERKLK